MTLPEPNAYSVNSGEFGDAWGIYGISNLPLLDGVLDAEDSFVVGADYQGGSFVFLSDEDEYRLVITADSGLFSYNNMYRIWIDDALILIVAVADDLVDQLVLDTDGVMPVLMAISGSEAGEHRLWIDHISDVLNLPKTESPEGWYYGDSGYALAARSISCKLYDTLVSFDWPMFSPDSTYETVIWYMYSNGFEFRIRGIVSTPYRVEHFSPSVSGDVELEKIRFFCRLPDSRWSSVMIDYSARVSVSVLSDVELSEIPALT